MLLKGKVLTLNLNFELAQVELRRYLKLKPDAADVPKLIELCGNADVDKPLTLMPIVQWFLTTKESTVLTGLRKVRNNILRPYKAQIERSWPGLGRLLLMDIDGKLTMNLDGQKSVVTNLTPLNGIPLSVLNLANCFNLKSLEPLRGMRLTWLNLAFCYEIHDLGPLDRMPITWLDIKSCKKIVNFEVLKTLSLTGLVLQDCHQVQDLKAFTGLALTYLDLGLCPVSDLKPIEKMPLTSLNLYGTQVRSIAPLRNLQLKHPRSR